jgi:hypothetical protein
MNATSDEVLYNNKVWRIRYSFVDSTKSCPVFYNEGRQVCHAVLSCLCKDNNKGSCDDLVRISIMVQKIFILTQSHITIDEPWYYC